MKPFFAAWLYLFVAIAAAQSDEQTARYQALIAELRCLVCQNQTIAESNAPLAADLREQVRVQIASGKTDAEIIEFVTARYGDFVLYRPPFKPRTWLLWLGPFAVLLLAATVATVFIRRSRYGAASADEIPGGFGPEPAAPSPTPGFPRGAAALTVAGLLAFAGIWYALAGSWRTQALVSLARTNPEAADKAMVEDMLLQLQQHVKSQPDDAEGWAWLGRSYMKRERYPEAAAALARANELTAVRDPDLLTEEGEALAYTQNRSLAGAPLAKFEAALSLAPDHPRALWFAGLAALHAGKDRTAVEYWERLQRQELPDEVRASLDHSLAQLRQRAGLEPAASGAQAAAGALTLRLEIEVAPELLPEVRPEDTLFVYAQAVVEGAGRGNPPLAARRFQADRFPLQVSLDDSHSMMPARKLSGAQRWRLVARLSRTGNALPQAGDLEGDLLVERDQAGRLQRLTIDRRHAPVSN